jgi:ABC-type phosphate/phosphonate transport system substrate-binding protein
MSRAISRFLGMGALIFACVFNSSCGSSEDAQAAAVNRVAQCKSVALAALPGVLGCVTSSSDVGPASVDVVSGFSVSIFPSAAQQPSAGQAALKSALSDATGVFRIDIAAGNYWLCTSFLRCTVLEVLAGGSTRRNYDFGVGPGW